MTDEQLKKITGALDIIIVLLFFIMLNTCN